MRWFFAIIMAGAVAAAAQACAGEVRPNGLMVVDSDLPRVFPLIIRMPDDRDVYLELSRDGVRVLSAYGRAGTPFRILVPPGRFDLDLYQGREWSGPARLFGPDTQSVELDGPLEFSTHGMARKDGWVIDLHSDTDQAGLRRVAICQSDRLERPDDPVGRAPLSERIGTLAHAQVPDAPVHRTFSRVCGVPERP
ncbi:hypothetical protein ERN12_11775 [Rhodobacteraceae bacterium]|nr:hypothetical protein ERN12_11775 [Paracoccaceae bacterium]